MRRNWSSWLPAPELTAFFISHLLQTNCSIPFRHIWLPDRIFEYLTPLLDKYFSQPQSETLIIHPSCPALHMVVESDDLYIRKPLWGPREIIWFKHQTCLFLRFRQGLPRLRQACEQLQLP